jgi:hypothetical protein
MIKSVMMPSIV